LIEDPGMTVARPVGWVAGGSTCPDLTVVIDGDLPGILRDQADRGALTPT
jgi:hypothetical protein